ncbi:protein LATERAL ORGAN BOUNDARIES-like [Malania oleifera]|uniref:protein LATERAL ORGAN BOUNDARIES-like n=1 Tax=Malania oleifera TaxID=397392 RepID=UPI0025AE9196|nr:protein LATERAL ORGAN BOUNDARIES-like [Malania oleifera]
MASSSSYNSPCAACKFLRRKCMPGCIFAPYFPPEEPQKFANVHKIFGASNVTKLLNELLPHQREDAVNSLAYEAEARVRDPVYGCVGAISFLQRQVQRLQRELDEANADLIRYACNEINSTALPPGPSSAARHRPDQLNRRMGSQGGGFYQQAPTNFHLPYGTPPWDDHSQGGGGGGGNIGVIIARYMRNFHSADPAWFYLMDPYPVNRRLLLSFNIYGAGCPAPSTFPAPPALPEMLTFPAAHC